MSAFSMAALLHQDLEPSGLLSAQVGMRLTDETIKTKGKTSALREGFSVLSLTSRWIYHEGEVMPYICERVANY